ncbi:hypothetical protein SAMN06265173_11240 [Thalassovita litoralis]|uniref:Uncharacterized protein n=1 Tax=Thalassovita litoralis TaxID=1010611 RepID=A0A521DQM1_9RHOB|nr:hypothetical protein [Thalassovita litoralis]SMO73928.1 hypothetical protein SAMN06265173_11240 [Thalassovita litoralis]
MAIMKAFRETALPGTLQPYSIYYIANPATPNYVEIYVTNAAGDATRRIHTDSDLDTKIAAALAGVGQGTAVVADITARDALTAETGVTVLVLDASSDATVAAGAATYVYDGSAWVKITEHESMDVTISWTDIASRPSSTPAQIDAAVTASHSHANKTQLDKVGEDGNGDMTYDGALPKTAWGSTGW